MERPEMRVSGPTIDAAEPLALAEFYERLLGWPIVRREGPRDGMPSTDGWAMLRSPVGDMKIEVQWDRHYRPPVWPSADGDQLMMIHLDVGVADLEAGISWAVTQGATVAEHQPQDDVRVMLDPEAIPSAPSQTIRSDARFCAPPIEGCTAHALQLPGYCGLILGGLGNSANHVGLHDAEWCDERLVEHSRVHHRSKQRNRAARCYSVRRSRRAHSRLRPAERRLGVAARSNSASHPDRHGRNRTSISVGSVLRSRRGGRASHAARHVRW